jgi:hypothetical protein
MAPPVETFPAAQLPERVQVTAQGRRRKGGNIDLKKCDLMEMVQYNCWLEPGPGYREEVVKCQPVVRLFRRYALS